MSNPLTLLIQTKIKEVIESDFPSTQPLLWKDWGSLFPQDCFSNSPPLTPFESLENGSPIPFLAETKIVQPEDAAFFFQWGAEMGVNIPSDTPFPGVNPLTLEPIDWDQEISRQNLESLAKESTQKAKSEALSQDAKINRLTQLMLLALKSGNISLAMLIFSHLEAKTANEMTRALVQKMQNIQQHKRDLSTQIQNQSNDAEGSKNIQQIKTEMESANDDLTVIQTFIRDIAQNKQQSIELANAFLSSEHEMKMSIIRSFGK